MVHYEQSWVGTLNPPPICPKCGSHRTQVVGLSSDGQTIIVRCNVCGERSEVKQIPDEDAARPERLPATGAGDIFEWLNT
jgi:tRNA(Ile2) C34 agmatinyltransferase TiaS